MLNDGDFQSIGWVYNAIWVPHEKLTETKVRLADTGEEFKAVWGKSIHYKLSKHPEVKKRLESGKPLNLLVYPYTNNKGQITKFLINGMYLPTVKPEEELESLFGDLAIEEGTTGFFKIQGRLVDHDPKDNLIGIKIERNRPAKPSKANYQEWRGFKNTILGELPKKDTVPGDFWDLLCELQGDKVVLIDPRFHKPHDWSRLFGNPKKRDRYKPYMKPVKNKSRKPKKVNDITIKRTRPKLVIPEPKKLRLMKDIEVC